ncbi:MAG: signal peptidase II [Polyangiaceae bacterium]|nr:signal peptidase II [Polyangiaceae bacterium]
MSDAETKEGTAQDAKDEASPKTDETAALAPKADDAAAQAKPAYRPPYAFLVIVSAVTLVADLGTKHWAVKNLSDPFERREIIDGFLGLVLAHNPGGAWGLLQNESPAVRVPFFILVSIVAIGFIVSLYRKLAPDQTALRWGLPLVLGGALGNLVDRIRYRHVIDFIDMYTREGTWLDNFIERFTGPTRGGYHWPTYNIADIAIVAGVLLMAVDMFQSRKAEKKAEAAK